MKRCECAGKAFEEVATLVARERIVDLDLICRRSGCAQLCTACRPDLERFLSARGIASAGRLAAR